MPRVSPPNKKHAAAFNRKHPRPLAGPWSIAYTRVFYGVSSKTIQRWRNGSRQGPS